MLYCNCLTVFVMLERYCCLSFYSDVNGLQIDHIIDMFIKHAYMFHSFGIAGYLSST